MKRLIVAVTGASGVIYGIRALEILRGLAEIETHLILSPSAARTIAEETDCSIERVRALGDVVYSHKDIGAAISSGSFRTEGMLVAPCSIKTLSGIANCFDEELVVRAADVCLKERRRVVLLVRETPLHAGHIELMARATANGAIVMPPVPGFYHRPASVDDIVTQSVGRALDLFGIDARVVKRWTEFEPARAPKSARGAAGAMHADDDSEA
jgi:4-hydroxy-3-polyprenylbenzoate decarboxylase